MAVPRRYLLLNTARRSATRPQATGHARAVQMLDPVLHGAGADARVDQRVDGIPMLEALLVGGELRALQDVLDPERAEETPHHLVGAGGDCHLAVGG